MHRIVLTSGLWLLLFPSLVHAQTFRGPYGGIEFGRQQVIGGSLVDGVDTLHQDSRWVTSLFGGARAQAGWFVIGGELGMGFLDGTLALTDDARALAIDYRTNRQWHWSAHAGVSAGESSVIFGYVSEVTRTFDVTISQAGQLFSQQDEQGLLRFGAGIEFRLRKGLHLRMTGGTSRADFGDRPTNITVGRQFEGGAGLVLQF